MNIAPNQLPATALAPPEAPRALQPPNHESSRPVVAPNAAEAMAQETRHDEEDRQDRRIEHKDEQHSTAHSNAGSSAPRPAAPEPVTSTEPHTHAAGNLMVGSLLDVFV